MGFGWVGSFEMAVMVTGIEIVVRGGGGRLLGRAWLRRRLWCGLLSPRASVGCWDYWMEEVRTVGV